MIHELIPVDYKCPLQKMAKQVTSAILIASILLPLALRAQDSDPSTEDFFESRIRPLLIEACHECHGMDTAEAGLRLDSLQAALEGGDHGPAIDRDHPQRSLLIRAVDYEDRQLSMPPTGKLSDNQISDLKQWVAAGAIWPTRTTTLLAETKTEWNQDHWAFQPLKVELPPVVDEMGGWVRNEIDQFVLAKLQANELTPSAAASRPTLVRRIFFDLIGLPPSYEQMQKYGSKPTSVDQLIRDLLADDAYGERWGRHWMDVARYADTKGYVDGGQRRYAFAYTYRNYIIRSLNEDLPYDEFITDQLAADQRYYESDERWRLAGMGFLTVGRRFNHNYYDTLDDQIDVISRGLQGLTVSCARCHDHKYDPIPTADYYSLYGILATSEEPPHSELPVISNTSESPLHQQELQRRTREYRRRFKDLHAQIEDELRTFAGDYLVYVVGEDSRHRTDSQNPLQTERTILRGPTAYGYGAIRRWRTYLQTRKSDDAVFGLWVDLDKVSPRSFLAELEKRVSSPNVNELLKARVASGAPQSMIELARIYGQLFEEIHRKWMAAIAENPNLTILASPEEEAFRHVLYGPDSPAVLTPFESIDCYSLDEHVELRNLAGKIEEASVDAEDAADRALLLTKRQQQFQPRIFRRGRPDNPGHAVPARIPACFAPLDLRNGGFRRYPGRDRLDIANAITSTDNPLTARVIVNRVWNWHFGQPLVRTPSDFGLRSTPPTHPRLLDFLADWFIQNGWSLKKLHLFIMQSATYQQSSVQRSTCMQSDPDNRLFWRFRPRRLQWEAIRDALLTVSGRLVRNYRGRSIQMLPSDANSVHRSVYMEIDRQEIARFAQYFDFPSPDFTCPQRTTTIVPQQQLFFLNSPFVWKQAEALGAVVANSDDDEIGKFHALHRRIFAVDAALPVAKIRKLMEAFNLANHDTSSNVWSVVAHGMLQSNQFIMLE